MKWEEEFITFNSKQRKQIKESIYSRVYGTHNGKSFLNQIGSQLKFIGFSPGIDYIKTNSHKVCINKFPEPSLCFYLKNSPVLILLDNNLKMGCSSLVNPRSYVLKKREIIGSESDSRYMQWVIPFATSSPKSKEEFKKTMLNSGIQEKYSNLYSFLTLSPDIEFVGYAIGINYYKENGSEEDLMAQFEHPFGGPTLIYKAKKVPAYLITNPTIRFNGSYLKEVGQNKYNESILGVTD